MRELYIDFTSEETIKTGFDKIAEKLFREYILQINEANYRLLDIEFYYHSEGIYDDIYTHKNKHQLNNGKWYFHGSGMDLTFGNRKNHGGILIRAIGKILASAGENKYYLEEIHGPLNVKTEICSNLHGAFEEKENIFRFVKVKGSKIHSLYIQPNHIIKTNRIGLNSAKETERKFHDAKLRYVIFPKLKLKDKTQVAKDMKAQFDLSDEEVNKELGSKFL